MKSAQPTAVAAQISLYPIRQPTLSPAITEALEIFEEHGLDVQPGSMSTVVTGGDTELFAALQRVYRENAARGDVVLVVTLSNACPV
jgi:uncharacterized protein YqgV (UPF0045/DUF77 family)